MKYVPQPPFTSDHIYVGNIKLAKGENKLTTDQLNVIKKHSSYSYYCEKGILCPNSQEQKPNGKERALAKKDKEVVEEKVEAPVPDTIVEPSLLIEEPKPKRKRTSRKKPEASPSES